MTKPFNKKLTQLADVFNDYYDPTLVPTKLEDATQPLSLPPSKMEKLINPLDPQAVVEERKEKLSETFTKENNSQPKPPLTKQENKQNFTKQENKRELQEELQQDVVGEQQQVKRKPGRPKGSKNKRTIEKLSQQQVLRQSLTKQERDLVLGAENNSGTEKLSQASPRELMLKKLSQARANRGRKSDNNIIPVDVKMSQFTGKGQTSLSYVFLYTSILTPVEVEILLDNSGDLGLTSAEIIALSLIDKTLKHDVKAEKIYWDLLKTQAKNEKITPVKQEKSLLDEALAKSENAIFGEIVVDTEENP